MKKHLFRIIAVLSAAVLLAGCAASRLRLGAAAAGGVYNAFGTAMSAQNSTIEVKQTAGSAANLRLLAGGYLQLAIAQSDMAQDAYDGSGVFAHESTERSFSAVAALYEEAVQVVVRADSGITTLEDKSCGCVQKGGSAPIMDVIDYGEPVTTKGLNMLYGPGNDLVSATALTAAGAHMVLFSTGRGTPFGAPAPTLKIATNSQLAARKKTWIDFNAGVVADGERTLDEAGADLYQLVLDVASGKQTCAEKKGFREISIFKDGVVL